jgi:hypothetical protein
MSQALKTSDPNQQMQMYDQVVRIDPNNAAAVQGYKEAAAKAAAQQQEVEQQQTQTQQQAVTESQRDQQVSALLVSAQSSFLVGDVKQADASLRIAERLAPRNPLVSDLRSKINAAFSLRHRLVLLGSTAGILALFGAGGLFWRTRRQVRFPVLHVVHGLDQGRVYPVDRDIIRIGGIAQDGGQKNDIVIRDVEHMVSRFHCEVVKKNGEFFLVDTNSSNGTSVNGEPSFQQTAKITKLLNLLASRAEDVTTGLRDYFDQALKPQFVQTLADRRFADPQGACKVVFREWLPQIQGP